MSQQQYKIVFRGEFAAGLSREEVVANLDERFRFSEAALDRIQTGKVVVLKRDLDEERAIRIAQALSDAGACCSAEPMAAETPAPEPAVAAENMVCPKCGQEQLEAEVCSGCGVVIAKFLQRQEEDAAVRTGAAEDEGKTAGHVATEGIASALAGTRPWVRLFSILMFIGAGLGLLATVITLVAGGAQGAPVGLIALVQVVSCALYIIPAYFLYKYAGAIGTYLQGEEVADLEVALGYQKSFWKFVGILTAVMMGIAVIGIAAAILIPAMVGG